MRCAGLATACNLGSGLVLAIGVVASAHADDDNSVAAESLGSAALATLAARSGGDAPVEPVPRLTRSAPLDDPRPPAGRRGESSELHYHWWSNRGRADVGVGFGTLTYTLRPIGGTPAPVAADDAGTTRFALGSFATIGMRYRTSPQSSLFADAIHWRGNGPDNGEAVVSGKVGVEFKSARSQWNVAYGGLGLRLAGDTRMTLKVRRGGLGLTMRTAF